MKRTLVAVLAVIAIVGGQPRADTPVPARAALHTPTMAQFMSAGYPMGNELIGRIVGDVKFTVKAIEGPLARIDVALVLKQEIAPPPGPNGMTVRLGDARGAGDLVFDVAKGRIQESTMKSDLPSRMTMQAPDGSMANMENKTTTTVKMVLVEK